MNDKTPYSPFRRLIKLLQVNRQDIASIYVFALFSGLISLSLPLGIQAIINLLGSGVVSTSWVILIIGVIAGVAIVGILQILQLRITEHIQRRIFTHFCFRICIPNSSNSNGCSQWKIHPRIGQSFF